jgi:hypothetical protein
MKENPKIIIEEKEYVLMQSHARSMEKNDKMSQHSFHVLEDPIACVEIQPYVGNEIEDSFKSGRTTLPLCFSSFELLKKNICSISGQGSSKHERSGDDNSMDNHIKGHVSSDLQSMFSYQPEKEEEVAPESIVQGHFLHPEISMDSQHEKVFQSIFSSLENDIVVKFLRNIDMDEDSEIASMEVSNNKETNDIDEAVYAIFPSETQKDNEEAMVLFKSFENQGFENPSAGALYCEVVA